MDCRHFNYKAMRIAGELNISLVDFIRGHSLYEKMKRSRSPMDSIRLASKRSIRLMKYYRDNHPNFSSEYNKK